MFMVFFVSIHSVLCFEYIERGIQSINITSYPILKACMLLITNIIFLYQLSSAPLECLVNVSVAFRIFLSVWLRTNCIYGVEEIFTCKAGGLFSV